MYVSALMQGVPEACFHTIPYNSMPFLTIPYHAMNVVLFWGYWIMGDLGWQPSWGRILGEEEPNRDKFGAVAGLQWCSGGRCQSHLFEASPGNDSPRDVCWLCVWLMPWGWWIFRPKCGSIPFGIQRLVRLHPGQTVCADAKKWSKMRLFFVLLLNFCNLTYAPLPSNVSPERP